MDLIKGELLSKTFDYDSGREVSIYVPSTKPEAVLFAGDGQLFVQWVADLEATGVAPTMVVGVHRSPDEERRLHEYSPAFEPARFEAHEHFFVDEVRRWVTAHFGVALPAARTGLVGVSAGGELALAIGLRHPDVFGVVLCASPGGGYRPPARMPDLLPRFYFVAGTEEPFFLKNAARWAAALRRVGAEVMITERSGTHGALLWRPEFSEMVRWAFGPPKASAP